MKKGEYKSDWYNSRVVYFIFGLIVIGFTYLDYGFFFKFFNILTILLFIPGIEFILFSLNFLKRNKIGDYSLLIMILILFCFLSFLAIGLVIITPIFLIISLWSLIIAVKEKMKK